MRSGLFGVFSPPLNRGGRLYRRQIPLKMKRVHSKMDFRDVAQPGSALAWGARGRWFESSRPDNYQIQRGQRAR